MTAKEHFEAGQISEALEAALADVKQHPTDIAKRSFLCELFCFSGEWERADKQLDILGTQDPDAMMGVALFRQLIRAETSRQEFFDKGHVPEFVNGPTDAQKLAMEASISLRDDDTPRALELLSEAEEARPSVNGQCDGKAFDECGIPGYRARIRPIVSRITIHWPSFYNVVTGKTLALPNLIALQHIPLSPAGVIAKRPAPIALPNSCAAEWRMAPDAVFSPYASVRYFTPHMVHSQYNLL